MQELLTLLVVLGAVLYLWRKGNLWLTGKFCGTSCAGVCKLCHQGGRDVFKGLSGGFSGADKGVKRTFSSKKAPFRNGPCPR